MLLLSFAIHLLRPDSSSVLVACEERGGGPNTNMMGHTHTHVTRGRNWRLSNKYKQ